MKALLNVGGETVSILLETTPEQIEDEKRVLRGMYKGEHIKVKIKENDK